jgi:hypothetical protein
LRALHAPLKAAQALDVAEAVRVAASADGAAAAAVRGARRRHDVGAAVRTATAAHNARRRVEHVLALGERVRGGGVVVGGVGRVGWVDGVNGISAVGVRGGGVSGDGCDD